MIDMAPHHEGAAGPIINSHLVSHTIMLSLSLSIFLSPSSLSLSNTLAMGQVPHMLTLEHWPAVLQVLDVAG